MSTDAWPEGRGLGCGEKSQGGGKTGIGSFADAGGASQHLINISPPIIKNNSA